MDREGEPAEVEGTLGQGPLPLRIEDVDGERNRIRELKASDNTSHDSVEGGGVPKIDAKDKNRWRDENQVGHDGDLPALVDLGKERRKSLISSQGPDCASRGAPEVKASRHGHSGADAVSEDGEAHLAGAVEQDLGEGA